MAPLPAPTEIVAPLTGAANTAATATVSAVTGVAFVAVGAVVVAAEQTSGMARVAVTAVAGERTACVLLGCDHPVPKIISGHRYSSCRWCGTTAWVPVGNAGFVAA